MKKKHDFNILREKLRIVHDPVRSVHCVIIGNLKQTKSFPKPYCIYSISYFLQDSFSNLMSVLSFISYSNFINYYSGYRSKSVTILNYYQSEIMILCKRENKYIVKVVSEILIATYLWSSLDIYIFIYLIVVKSIYTSYYNENFATISKEKFSKLYLFFFT